MAPSDFEQLYLSELSRLNCTAVGESARQCCISGRNKRIVLCGRACCAGPCVDGGLLRVAVELEVDYAEHFGFGSGLADSGGDCQAHDVCLRFGNRPAVLAQSGDMHLNSLAEQFFGLRAGLGSYSQSWQVRNIGAPSSGCSLEYCRVFLHFKPACLRMFPKVPLAISCDG